MKNLLGLLFCILAFVSNAANPSFNSFDTKYFSTTSQNIQGMIGTNVTDGSLTNRNQTLGFVGIAGTNAAITSRSVGGLPIVVLGNTNTVAQWNYDQGLSGPVLLHRFNISNGDPDTWMIDFGIGQSTNVYAAGSNFYVDGSTNKIEMFLSSDSIAGSGPYLSFIGVNGSRSRLIVGAENHDRFRFDAYHDGSHPVLLIDSESNIADDGSQLAQFNNHGTNKFIILGNGDLYWGANATVGYKAPIGHGATNSVLTDTNGSGALSWQPASAGQTNWPVSAITNAGTAAYSNATAFALAQSGTIVTQNNSFALTLSNNVTVDAAHNITSAAITNSGNIQTATLNTTGAGKIVGTLTMGLGLNQVGAATSRIYDISSYSTMISVASGSGIALEGTSTITGDAGASGIARDASGGVKAVRMNAGSVGALTNMVFAFAVMPTNYVASNFTPISGMVSIVASNGILYKVTQLSTNLLSALTP